jgi:GDP-mannose 6-dehydrogenase
MPNDNLIAVVGLGYIGSVTAACLASLGYRVVGVDTDEIKVNALRRRAAPFYEPGLDEIVRTVIGEGRLTVTTSLADVLPEAAIVFICVGTPSEANGDISLTPLRRVTAEIARLVEGRTAPLVLAVRSTVYPGTCEKVLMAGIGDNPAVSVVSNPEFLREGTAVHDFLFPSLVVVGGSNSDAVRRVAAVYEPLNVEPALVSLRTAEMIKYACNCFHAVKIAFANEVGTLASRLGVPGEEVMDTVCRDVRLNVSPAYLKPGFAFGGSCLPKDLRALSYRAVHADVHLPLLQSVLPSNEEHLRRAIREVLDTAGPRIGIYGLSFKEGTDDLRESPAVSLIEVLVGKGREIRVFDPHIRLDSIYGSNRNYVLAMIPHIGKLLDGSLENVLGWAETVLITQKPDAATAARLAQWKGRTMDLTRAASSSCARGVSA